MTSLIRVSDKQSVQWAHNIFNKNNIEKASTIPYFHQLKKRRSKSDKFSTDAHYRMLSVMAKTL
ncbi:hypothetical protein J3Q64DRAFT_1770042 [Phycomyces blakesleeanus]|uniref:Uncharacterized protein n=1 Tax=Phycomyces blakesleeanus TaxID=4837 RepID=A0ABR3AMA6_PHYBL